MLRELTDLLNNDPRVRRERLVCWTAVAFFTSHRCQPTHITSHQGFIEAATVFMKELAKEKPYCDIFLYPVSKKDAPDYAQVIPVCFLVPEAFHSHAVYSTLSTYLPSGRS